MTRTILVTGLTCALLGCPWVAHADDTHPPQQPSVSDMRQQAMAAYHELDIDRALGLLQQALQLAEAQQQGGEALAMVHLALGVVHAAGLGDAPTARAHMHQAVCAHVAIEHDMLVATPALEELLQSARQDARAMGCPGEARAVVQSTDPELPPVFKKRKPKKPEQRPRRRTKGPDGGGGRGMFVQVGPAIGISRIDRGMAADRTDPGLSPDDPRACCVQIRSAGLTPHGAVRAHVGVFVSESVALAAVLRVQLRAGQGPWAGLLVGGRVEHIAWAAGRRAPSLSWFAGMGAGRLDVQPATGTSGVYATSGLAGAQLGAGLRVPMGERSAFVLSPELDVRFPDVMFTLDLMTGVELTID